MKADVFLDSNVLLYAAADVKEEGAKKEAALRLIADTDFGTSVQVLGEFYDNARRKAKLAIGPERMREVLRLLKSRPLVEETAALFDRAVALAERYGIRSTTRPLWPRRRNWGPGHSTARTFRTARTMAG